MQTVNREKTSPRDATARILAALTAFLLAISTHAAGLFYDVPAPGLQISRHPTVSRARTATLNVPALENYRAAGARLQLNWFPGQEHEAVVGEVIDRGPGNYTLLGSVVGQPHSSFSLVVKNDVAVMNVRTGPDLFQLRYLGNSLYDIQQIDQGKFPPCSHGPPQAGAPDLPDDGGGDVPPPETAGGAATTIDLMVVYTPAARAAAGGVSAIEALINLAIDEANTAYSNSLINARLRLVHSAEVNYTESGSYTTDIDRLTGSGDGYMDAVHQLRDTYGADVVSLLSNDGSSCGYAWIMTSLSTGFASSAFNVVNWTCATGYYSLAHEIGHNMGCSHDRNNPTVALYGYSYGWQFTGNDGAAYRTVMAYAPGTRIQHFSNPNVTFQGVPTGVPSNQANAADNAQTINNSAATVASFRQSVAGCTGTSVSPSTTNVPANSGPVTFAIDAPTDCSWSAVSGSPFITIAIPSGTGPGSLICNIASNSAAVARTGTVSVAGQTVTIIQALSPDAITIGQAVDAPSLIWNTGGNSPWFGQKTTASDTTGAAESGNINRQQQTWLETTITGPGTLWFSWKVSSQTNGDWLTFSLNGTVSNQISGEVDWQRKSAPIPAGTHTVRWAFAKDGKGDGGADTAWLDQVSVVPDINTPPLANADTLVRSGTNGTKVLISTLLANDTDPNADAISFVSADPVSQNGAAISSANGWLYYSPPPTLTASDTFTYTIRDARGAEASGLVTVTIQPISTSGNLSVAYVGDNTFRIRLDGVPGKRYILQYSSTLISAVWQDLSSGAADENGLLEFLDTTTESPRYYRTLSE